MKCKIGAGFLMFVVLAVLATSLIRATPPTVTMNVVSRFATNDVVEYTVGLTNRGQPITYVGYAKDSPAYTSIREGRLGRITNSVRCGPGMSEQTLSHDEGVQFKLRFATTNEPVAAMVHYSQARWFDRVFARAPNFIRAKLSRREFRSVEVRLSENPTS